MLPIISEYIQFLQSTIVRCFYMVYRRWIFLVTILLSPTGDDSEILRFVVN